MGIIGRKKNWANRPSESHRQYVQTRDGRTVLNKAYDAKAEAAFKAKQKMEKPSRSTAREDLTPDQLNANTDKILDYTRDPEVFADAEKARTYYRSVHEIRQNMDKELKAELRKKDPDMDRVFDMRQTLKSASLDEFIAKEMLDNEEDAAARRLENRLKRSPIAEAYHENHLGSASMAYDFEDGSLEWLNARKNGIGGSEVLAAAGLQDAVYKKTGKIRKMSENSDEWQLIEMANDKLADATEEDVSSERAGAAWRGHAWEEALLGEYKDITGKRVAIGKSTWKGAEDYQLVNLDGIILDDDGKPEGVIECKTSESPEKWEDGVPPSYRAQLLYQLDATGLEYGDIVARVGGKVETHRIYAGESIDGTDDGLTINDIKPKLQQKWDTLQENRANGTRPQVAKRTPIPDGTYHMTQATDNITALLGGSKSRDAVKEDLKKYQASEGSLDAGVRKYLSDNFDRGRMGRAVGVDGETSSIASNSFDGDKRKFSANYDDWIETGIVTHDGTGAKAGEFQQFHGIDDRISSRVGTGAEDVHGIKMKDVRNKPRLSQESTEVRDQLLDGDILVAHNVDFEKSHLNANVRGVEGKRPWLDTKWLAKHFSDRNGKGNRLEDFCGDNGVPYVDAHRAKNDAGMMMTAMENFFSDTDWMHKGSK